MSLYDLLKDRAQKGKPVRVGVIGAGTFAAAFFSQARQTQGMQIAAVADLDTGKARAALTTLGWPDSLVGLAQSPSVVNDGSASGKTMITERANNLIGADLDVIVEATGMTDAGA